MPSVIDRLLALLSPEFRQIRADITALQAQQEQMMAKQDAVDQKFTELGDAVGEVSMSVQGIDTSVKGIASDLEWLKNHTTPGEPMSDENFARLSSIVNAAKAAATATGEAATQAKALDDAFTPPTEG